MKKLLLIIFIFSTLTYSQEVILEGDFKTKPKPFSGAFTLPTYSKQNKIIINMMKSLTDAKYNTLDKNGNVEELDYTWKSEHFLESISGKTKLFFYRNSMPYEIITNNGKKYTLKKKIAERLRSFSGINNYIKSQNLTDDYIINFQNQKEKFKIDFISDDIYLLLYDFKNQKFIKNKIEKPSLEKFENQKENVGFSIEVISNENFYLITKTIDESYKSCKIYLTKYDFNGKIVDEKKLDINADDSYLLFSNNYQGQFYFDKTSPAGKDIFKFADGLFINGFKFVPKDKEIYISGVYGDEPSNLNSKIKIKGYYVYKYNLNGELIWKKFKNINDSEINRDLFSFLTKTGLRFINENELFFVIEGDRLKHYLYFSVFDKQDGEEIISKAFEKKDKQKVVYYNVQFLYGGAELKEFPNKLFDDITIANIYSDGKFRDYIQSVDSKKDIIFMTLKLKDYKILIESDNKKYYKFIRFDN